MDELILMQENRVVGRICAEPNGAYIKLFAECQTELEGIWRAYLVCEEREWLIGVLAPRENHGFSAWGRVAKSELPNLSACHGVIRFGRTICENSPDWMVCPDPQTVFRDSVLRTSMQAANGVLTDSAEHPTKIAIPLKNGCACAPALCLAHMMYYRGEEYAVLHVDENGNLSQVAEQKENNSV